MKKDGSRIPYNRNKILAGLQAACYKRPVSDTSLREIVDATEEEIFKHWEKEVPSSFIGDVVSRRLRSVDEVAYVRFASVYRAFEDVGEFIEEAHDVLSTPGDTPAQRRLFDGDPSDTASR
jgi:transcriptional repressor NrdR